MLMRDLTTRSDEVFKEVMRRMEQFGADPARRTEEIVAA